MNSSALTEQILTLRKETDAFRQSIETRSEKLAYTFYDGPPFTSGDPHYGHLLQSIVKDMVPRRMTMRGYRVARKRGRDCHGIPAENFVNKKLGITSKKQVEEEFGLKNYIEACRSMVNQVNDNRKWTIDRIGRRVDMENAYFTMDINYMESVICLFSDLYHRNLIYKGFKVLGYSRALGTALSNSEIAEGYEMRQDPAVTVKLQLKNNKKIIGKQFLTLPGDDAVEVVVGVLKDEKGRVLMMFKNKHNVRYFPGGKVELGETPADALKREILEEIGVEVTSEVFLGHAKTVHRNKVYRLHYFEITVAGTPQLQEIENHGMLERVEKIPADNALGYVLKFADLIITDPVQLRHEFADIHMLVDGMIGQEKGGSAGVYILPRTTTPRTLPANMFAAVHRDIQYIQVFDKQTQEYYILAQQCLPKYYKTPDEYIEVTTCKGAELVGILYTPLFDYYPHEEFKSQVHKILHADFVTTESGTGIVHEAPAFGADDYELVAGVLGKDNAQEWLFDPVNEYGEFTSDAPDFVGQNVIEANQSIIKELKIRNLLVKQETINHSYPHCPRTKTPLIYKAIESWFVKEDQLKQQTVPAAEQIHFVPETVKQRFINGLASAPDRNISRTRYRGAPLPVWECTSCGEVEVVGSIAEIEQRSGQHVTDLHRPYIDDIVFPCACGATKNRIPEVLDCWFESGAMPYGQDHFMKKLDFKKQTPEGYTLIDNLPEERRQEFRSIRLEAVEKEPGAFGPNKKHEVESGFDKNYWVAKLNDKSNYQLFLVYENELVGLMRAIQRKDELHVGGIFSVYIRKEHRGKGLGKIMMHACEKILSDIPSVSTLRVRVVSTEENSIQLYKKMGYIEVGSVSEDVYGLEMHELIMEKSVSSTLGNQNSGHSFTNCANFIAEGLDQTRGWFRALHVLGHAYHGQNVFQNVVVTGMILAEDGKKMSKSLQNYPDPSHLINQYGADALRLYLLGSPVVRAEPLRFSEKGVEQMLKDVVIPLQNVFNFFKMYAQVDQRQDTGTQVWFMRHALKQLDAEYAKKLSESTEGEVLEDLGRSLSDAGFAQLTSPEFIEQVVRIQPEVIICSDFLRAKQTAQGVQDVLREYLGKTVDVEFDDHRGWGAKPDSAFDSYNSKEEGEYADDAQAISDTYNELLKKHAGKRILIVSHKRRFRYLRQWLFTKKVDANSLEFRKLYEISSADVLLLPPSQVENELDQRVLAELHRTVVAVDSALKNYFIEEATLQLTSFVDKLTNRYLRRSRRRFWTEQMTADKQQAYHTLYTVLHTYLQLCAPFIPFVTEELWQELQVFTSSNDGDHPSVHLQAWPAGSSLYINQQLIDEIETVRKIIKGALYLRAKHQIKVKQPLPSLSFRV